MSISPKPIPDALDTDSIAYHDTSFIQLPGHNLRVPIVGDDGHRSKRRSIYRTFRSRSALALSHADSVVQTRLLIVNQLREQLLRLWEQIEMIEAALAMRMYSTETPMLDLRGIGVVAAARLIGELGCTPPLRSAAALAAFARIAPVAVSCRDRNGRRLNRGGKRRLNRPLHLIAVCPPRCEPSAQAYYTKKQAERKTARSAPRVGTGEEVRAYTAAAPPRYR